MTEHAYNAEATQRLWEAVFELMKAGADIAARDQNGHMPAQTWTWQLHRDLLAPEMQRSHPKELLRLHSLHFADPSTRRSDDLFSIVKGGGFTPKNIYQLWDEKFDPLILRRSIVPARADSVTVDYVRGGTGERGL